MGESESVLAAAFLIDFFAKGYYKMYKFDYLIRALMDDVAEGYSGKDFEEIGNAFKEGYALFLSGALESAE